METTSPMIETAGTTTEGPGTMLRDAARQSTWLLGVAAVALGYVLAIVAYGQIMHLVFRSFPPVGN